MKPLVLLADDNEATCTLIRALLHAEYDVETCGDGREAVAKLRSRPYHAVLLDLLMPITDGYGVLDFLTAERPDILPRVLVVTAAVTASQYERLSEYAIAEVIPKPFEVEALLSAVRRCAGTTGGKALKPDEDFLTSDLIL